MTERNVPAPHERPRRRRSSWYHPFALLRGLTIRPKLYLSIMVALATLYLAPMQFPLSARTVMAWNAGACTYLLLAFYLMSTCSIDAIRQRAEQEDETRFVFITIITLAVASSFSAVVGIIAEGKTVTGSAKAFYFALAGFAILASWLVMLVVFTLHYAHDYYRPTADVVAHDGGLHFPGSGDPDYWDFFYFATSIGATSQTSDVAITSKVLRRLVAMQAILSFVFNTTVVALAINLAAGLL